MLYIFSFLIAVLFINFLVVEKLADKATAQKELKKERLIIPVINTNKQAKCEWEGESSNIEFPIYTNIFLLT